MNSDGWMGDKTQAEYNIAVREDLKMLRDKFRFLAFWSALMATTNIFCFVIIILGCRK